MKNKYFTFRLLQEEDYKDLYNVYKDKRVFQYFNSDNCEDDFYYDTIEKMKKCVSFWLDSYKGGWFIRQTILYFNKAIGTIETCHRISDDYYNNKVVIRIDLAFDFEKKKYIKEILKYTLEYVKNNYVCDGVFIKGPFYAKERIKVFKSFGFSLSDKPLIDKHGNSLDSYYVLEYKSISITAGDCLNDLLSKQKESETFIPFREAMIEGSNSSKLFSNAFIKERANTHKVSVKEYKDKMDCFIKVLKNPNKYDCIYLYFGDETFCKANRKVVKDSLLLYGYKGKIISYIVDEYTGEIIKIEK